MSQRSPISRRNLPIKTSSSSLRRRLKTIMAFTAAFCGLTVAGAIPAWAQGAPISAGAKGFATLGVISWVQVTFASVVSVLVGWVLATVFLWVAGRMRWVTRHRQNRLARALQVALGGLLLMAVLLPYLAEHHPVVAMMLPLMGIVTMLAVGMRSVHLVDQNPTL